MLPAKKTAHGAKGKGTVNFIKHLLPPEGPGSYKHGRYSGYRNGLPWKPYVYRGNRDNTNSE